MRALSLKVIDSLAVTAREVARGLLQQVLRPIPKPIFSNRRRVLIATSFLPYPAKTGNTARILSIIRSYELADFDVTILYIRQSMASTRKARKRFGPRFIEVRDDWSRFSIFGHSYHACKSVTEKFLITSISDICTPPLLKKIAQSVPESYDIVIANYFFLSPVFEVFKSAKIRIIDSHDVFSSRRENLLSLGVKDDWFSTTEKIEREALNKGDIVVAIEKSEATRLSGLTSAKVVHVGYFDLDSKIARWSGAIPQISFIGGKCPTNSSAVEFLRNEVSPMLKRTVDLQVHTYGTAIKRDITGQLQCHGHVETLDDCFANSLATLNPVSFGTGMNIKVIASLSHGLPSITTRHGIRGCEDYLVEFPDMQAESASDFVSAISKLPQRRYEIDSLRQKIRSFYEVYEAEQIRKLAEASLI